MEFRSKEAVDQVLGALGEELSRLDGAPVDLLVCGGSALQALGLVYRTTKDVDVLAIIDANDLLITAKPLPAHLIEAAKKVARVMQLADDWINPGPTSALEMELPDGVLVRAEARTYGKTLTVRFISRYDQVHFKFFAAADQAGKHFDDLLALNPSAEELEAAARWTLTLDVSLAYRGEVRRLLTEMGHNDVAQRI